MLLIDSSLPLIENIEMSINKIIIIETKVLNSELAVYVVSDLFLK